ncbi:MAG TPA: aldo/keto reductase [Candidatus Acidoferrales bacterium]|nr:aldo/keto reductase [Candidatus Acidoferrales bacterium]
MSLTTYNHIALPSFMYGTAWKKEATKELVELAVTTGFKAIDTANQIIHYDEALVGDALQALEKRGIKRESLFVQTKFTPLNGQGGRPPYDPSADLTTQVNQSFASSLAHLHTDYLDSYVLHGPYQRWGLGQADWEVWAAIEELYRSGKTRMIGVSNVTPAQLREFCQRAQVKPMVVQNRCFAALGWDKEVREICRRENIVYQGFSLLTANVEFLSHPEIRRIAGRLKAAIAQVIFRFAMQVGMLPLTGTTNQRHMKEDLEAEKLALLPEEVERIETIAL